VPLNQGQGVAIGTPDDLHDVIRRQSKNTTLVSMPEWVNNTLKREYNREKDPIELYLSIWH